MIHALALCLLLADNPAPPQTVEPPLVEKVGDISGYYLCKGKAPSGSRYEGVCTIVQQEQVYLVSWAFPGQALLGFGFRQGDTLAVSWTQPNGTIGVNVYRIHPNGRLVGRWASMPGSGRLGDETLTFKEKRTEEEP